MTKNCRLCLQEKFEILSYPNPDELLKYRHVNILANYKANDCTTPIDISSNETNLIAISI